MQQTRQIAIVGIDGSGKSSTSKTVAEKINSSFVGDNLFVWKKNQKIIIKNNLSRIKNLLNKKSKYARNKTVYKILKLSEIIIRTKLEHQIQKKYKPKYIITDGSELINVLAWSSFYKKKLFKDQLIYESEKYMTGKRIPFSRWAFFAKELPEVFWMNLFNINFQAPDEIFFLKIMPKTALSRIQKRGKKLQSHENMKDLKQLQEAYLKVLKINKNLNIHILDTDGLTKEAVCDKIINIFYENN